MLQGRDLLTILSYTDEDRMGINSHCTEKTDTQWKSLIHKLSISNRDKRYILTDHDPLAATQLNEMLISTNYTRHVIITQPNNFQDHFPLYLIW